MLGKIAVPFDVVLEEQGCSSKQGAGADTKLKDLIETEDVCHLLANLWHAYNQAAVLQANERKASAAEQAAKQQREGEATLL